MNLPRAKDKHIWDSISRRSFCRGAIASAASLAVSEFLFGADRNSDSRLDLAKFERPRVLAAAKQYLNEPPITITSASSQRSAGGKHDYFSEGDYWWPD